MSWEMAFVLGLVVLVFAAFVRERFAPELIALAASAALLSAQIISTNEFLGVFSNSAPMTIAMMFIISASLERTGVLRSLGKVLTRAAGGSLWRTMLVLMLVVMLSSAFMNNTPIVVLLTPVVIALAANIGSTPSKLLIPLSYASIFGGTLTLVGTSTNILMSGVAKEAGLAPIGMFEMTLPGLIFAASGAAYMLLIGRHLLPERHSFATLLSNKKKRPFIAELLIPQHSQHIGLSVAAFADKRDGMRVIDVRRNGHSLLNTLDTITLSAGDHIILSCGVGEMIGIKENGQLLFPRAPNAYEPISADKKLIVEASIPQHSSLKGKTLAKLELDRLYGVYVMALSRDRSEMHTAKQVSAMRLRFADTLLMEGPAEGIKRFSESGDIINLSQSQDRPVRRKKAPIAIATILAVMVLAALDVMPIAGLAMIGAVVVMLTGCVDSDEAFAAIDWRILFLIFGMLGLSIGMENTGAAAWIVDNVIALLGGTSPLMILLIVYALTSLLTEMVSNNAVAVLLGPIVIALAQQMGFDPRPFVMAVMFAASASFATPIGYQTNTFVYSAGGYQFADFARIGVPLNLLFALLAVIILPWFYPF